MTFWLIRITDTPKRNPTAQRDYAHFQEEIVAHQSGLWDKDEDNRMQVGDWVGFIVGPASAAVVRVFRVAEELTVAERQPWWSESHRVAVRLVPGPAQGYDWNDWRASVGLSSKYWPRGTNVTRNVPSHVDLGQ